MTISNQWGHNNIIIGVEVEGGGNVSGRHDLV